MNLAATVTRALGLGDQVRIAVPVDPDAETARTWARDELANPQYAHGESIFARFVDWVSGLFDGIGRTPSLGVPSMILLGVVLVVVVVVTFALAGRLRRTARPRRSATVLGDDSRSADDLRRAADSAADHGDWSRAVLERFRAVVRSLEDRAVLDERPGRTAHEVGVEVPRRLDVDQRALDLVCALFDEVCYGDRHASAADDASVREVDALLAAARRLPASAAQHEGASA